MPQEITATSVIEHLFAIRNLSVPDLTVDGQGAWFEVGLFGPMEKQLLGVHMDNREQRSAVRSYVGIAINSRQEILFAVPLPRELYDKAAQVPNVPWYDTRKQIGLTYLLSEAAKSLPQLQSVSVASGMA